MLNVGVDLQTESDADPDQTGLMKLGLKAMSEQRRSGLSRALFCVRQLEQRTESLPEHRLAFLIGALVAADMDALMARGTLANDQPLR